MSSHAFPIDRELRRKLDLLWLLITLKYKRTFLGILWSLLNPILLALVLFIAVTTILASHNLNAIKEICARAIWLDGEKIRAEGEPGRVIEMYLMA